MQENNPHKRPSEQISDPLDAIRYEGQKAANKFSANVPENPHPAGSEEAKAWAEGFDSSRRRMAGKAHAWFMIGAATPHGYSFAPSLFGPLVTAMMQTNGQAMACVFVGAMMVHAGEDHLLPTVDQARECIEAATYGSTNRPLLEHLKPYPAAERVHRWAGEMARFVTAEDEEAYQNGRATKLQVDADGLLRALVYGLEKQIITPEGS